MIGIYCCSHTETILQTDPISEAEFLDFQNNKMDSSRVNGLLNTLLIYFFFNQT